MTLFIIFVLYNFMVLPIIYIVVHITAIFHKKLRHGVWNRHFQWKKVTVPADRSCVIFHTASLGEYEHIRPLFPLLRKYCPKQKYLVNMFFSPSGYLNANREDGTDQYIYSPFDTPWAVWRLYHRLSPKVLIIVKHDIWPNQVWIAKLMKIPVIIINASLSKSSSRLKWWSKWFHTALYRDVNRIFTISEKDSENFLNLVKPEKTMIAGDTKFDQVLLRMEAAEKIELLPEKFHRDSFVIVLGSVWPADLEILSPVLKQVMIDNEDIRLVIAPHDPSEKLVKEISKQFRNSIKYTELETYSNEKIIVVDTVGVLATLYKYGHISYVGGSFKEGVHNVMEAAVYSVPVIYGPVLTGSTEAEAMSEPHMGGIIVRDSQSFRNELYRFIGDPDYRLKTGKEAQDFVMKHLGASKQISELICDLI